MPEVVDSGASHSVSSNESGCNFASAVPVDMLGKLTRIGSGEECSGRRPQSAPCFSVQLGTLPELRD